MHGLNILPGIDLFAPLSGSHFMLQACYSDQRDGVRTTCTARTCIQLATSKLINGNRELLMHLDFSYLSYNELNNYLKHAVFPNAAESERQTNDLIAYDDQSGF